MFNALPQLPPRCDVTSIIDQAREVTLARAVLHNAARQRGQRKREAKEAMIAEGPSNMSLPPDARIEARAAHSAPRY